MKHNNAILTISFAAIGSVNFIIAYFSTGINLSIFTFLTCSFFILSGIFIERTMNDSKKERQKPKFNVGEIIMHKISGKKYVITKVKEKSNYNEYEVSDGKFSEDNDYTDEIYMKESEIKNNKRNIKSKIKRGKIKKRR